jgi:hypothetical protein
MARLKAGSALQRRGSATLSAVVALAEPVLEAPLVARHRVTSPAVCYSGLRLRR